METDGPETTQEASRSLPPSDDGALIKRIKSGETSLFRQLLEPYERKMYVLAYSILRDHHGSEEAVQESAIKAFFRLDQLRSAEAFKCWLLQITINEARMRKRHARLHQWPSMNEDHKSFPEQDRCVREYPDWHENPEETLERKELESALECAWRNLPPKYQRVLQLRCTDGLSIPEMGKTLRLSVPAVKTQLHRARLHLKKGLVPLFPS